MHKFRILFFDDEEERARQLVKTLGLVTSLTVELSDDISVLAHKVSNNEVDLILLDMGEEGETGINLQRGEDVLRVLRELDHRVPVIIYSQYSMSVEMRRSLTQQYGVVDFVSKIAPEERLHKSVEAVLDIDLGPARWNAPDDQVLVEIVKFDFEKYGVDVMLPAWTGPQPIAVSIASDLFGQFRTDILSAASEGLSEEDPLVCYGTARLTVSDPRQLGLTLTRIAGRYPDLDSLNLDHLFDGDGKEQ